MKRLFQSLVVLALFFLLTLSTQAQLDTSFGTNGRTSVNVYLKDIPVKIIEKQDGKIVVVVKDQTDSLYPLTTIIQYNSNGTLDTSFANAGNLNLVDPTFNDRQLSIFEIESQSDGKLIVGGIARSPSLIRQFVARLNANGSFDSTFGSNGFLYPNMGSGYPIDFVKILSDGKIIVSGNTSFFIRYMPDGNLDASFNSTGFVFSALRGKVYGLADGKFVIKTEDNLIKRLNSDASIDTGFNEITFPFRSEVTIDNNNKIYVLFEENRTYSNDYSAYSRRDSILKRYLANGQIDNAFGNSGESYFYLAPVFAQGNVAFFKPNINVSGNGDIYVSKVQEFDTGNRSQLVGRKTGLVKLNSFGNVVGRYATDSIDTYFQNTGSLTILNSEKVISAFMNPISETNLADLTIQKFVDIPRKYINIRNFPNSTPAVFRPSNKTFYAGSEGAFFPSATANDTPYSFDRLSSFLLFNSNNGNWQLCSNCNYQWGTNGDIPVYTGDFDGDSLVDLTVFRPSNGIWAIKNSETGANTILQWGMNGDKPVPGDYDGDGKDDIAVWRPSDGVWYILNSSNNQYTFIQFGTNGDIPVQEDYDGDGKFDISVYRPSNGVWYRLNSSTNYGFFAVQWGISTDIPVPADYNNDGKTDMAVYRGGNWYVLTSNNYTFSAYNWGLPTDIPLSRRQ